MYIQSATDNFSKENRINTWRIAEEYTGQLLWSGELINISARRFNKERKDGEQLFWRGVSMLSTLKHKNVVSLVGFCDDNGEKIIITRATIMGSLDNYLSNPMMLTWVRRLEISVGIAQALSYIHYDESRDFSVIHRNINSETVLLNDNWQPKLSAFQHSLKIKASKRHHSFHTDSVNWSMKGHTDPTYEKTKRVSHNSDIYSFGMVLFELLCGRKSVIYHPNNEYLAPVAIFHYREKILDEIIDPKLRKQMDPRSLNIFAETAYECLSEEQSQRPNMDQIVTRLEKALELQLEWKNYEHSSIVDEVGETSSSHEKGSMSHIIFKGVQSHLSKKKMSSHEYIPFPFSLNYEDILMATNNFASENTIKKKPAESVYQGSIRLDKPTTLLISSVARRIYRKYQIDERKMFEMVIYRNWKYHKDEIKKFEKMKGMLSTLKHKNLVSFIGLYYNLNEIFIIYKKEANGSLNKYLNDLTLTWRQRLEICLGVANALSYIHYDVAHDFSVIHCNIRSSKILLDDKWKPKLSGFELSLKNTVARRNRLLLTRDIIENVYLDPKYKKTGGMTHKSDVYSFGVVLFEVLCGRGAVIRDEELEEGLLSQLAKFHLDDMIDPHLRKQMDPEAFKIFSETAYYCIQEERAKRPHIDQVVKRLEKALEHQWRHENPVERTSFNRLKVRNLFT
ncbi:serine/threonine/dual specificity protein kinase, catalytic domain-containing protein [Artemisia annua]|uniref:Serine/threonine/dual specificity protein kinase, catalytic domain-containing protein n=1 Tax=Artemisia annua TaxID=35608 RepID=A0A2U1KP63_ARTAN|nr:serine/threonine/dual specificity protein kinase, catalytic domain-containing protein [Artemisia annua]